MDTLTCHVLRRRTPVERPHGGDRVYGVPGRWSIPSPTREGFGKGLYHHRKKRCIPVQFYALFFTSIDFLHNTNHKNDRKHAYSKHISCIYIPLIDHMRGHLHFRLSLSKKWGSTLSVDGSTPTNVDTWSRTAS